MAIIPGIPHAIVDIVVDGNSLPEYLDKDDSESVTSNSIVKYVECMSGSNFAIRTNVTGNQRFQGSDSVEVSYCLDGQRIKGKALRHPWTNADGVFVRDSNRYHEGGDWKEQSLVFTDLVTTDEGKSGAPKPELKDLGTITVKLYHGNMLQSRKIERSHYSKIDAGQEKLHEKDLKEERSISAREIFFVKRLGGPFATFNFRYRSRKDLQILRLIPRTPSPTPLEDRPEESLSREEMLELLRKQKVRLESQIAIKQEAKRERMENDESDDEPSVISTQPATKKLKLPVADAIDLTDD